MKKLNDMNFQEILKVRTTYSFISNFISLPSMVFGLLIGNGIVNSSTPMIVGGAVGAAITLSTGMICGGKVEKIDKIFKQRRENEQLAHDKLIWKLENGYKEDDIISENFVEKE